MSPIAQAEIQRGAAARWTFADWSDALVAVVCALGVVYLIGMWHGAERATSAMRMCLQALDDGRSLNAFAIDDTGNHTKCSYESVRGRRK